MSKDETAAPSPKFAIRAATDAAPFWTGVKFTCAKCGGEFQLEAADKCELRSFRQRSMRAYATPPCPCSWTKPNESCGHVNIVEIQCDDETLDEGNPS